MANHPAIGVRVHHCPLLDMLKDRVSLPDHSNGGRPRIPLPLFSVAGRTWFLPIGDIQVPVNYCPYCGEDLVNG